MRFQIKDKEKTFVSFLNLVFVTSALVAVDFIPVACRHALAEIAAFHFVIDGFILWSHEAPCHHLRQMDDREVERRRE